MLSGVVGRGGRFGRGDCARQQVVQRKAAEMVSIS